MKPINRFLIAIFVCLALAVGSYIWVTQMLNSLYNLRSPLKDQRITPGEPVGPPATRRVVFVLVDGLRYDTAMNSEIMPTLAQLRQEGASAKGHSRPPSYSQPGYSTLMTGAWPGINDGPVMNWDYYEIPTWTQDNLFSATTRAGMKTAVSAYHWFEKLIPSEDTSASFYSQDSDSASDTSIVDAALVWLDDPRAYQFVLIHLMQVDYAGHKQGGPRSENWAAAAQRTDGLLDKILQKLDLTLDTILVSSDHGHIARGGHGGYDPDTLQEPFVLAGASVLPGAYEDVQMVDLAPTIATLLGVNIPASNQGLAQTGMLALPAVTIAHLPAALASQQEQMVNAYGAGIGEEVQRPVTEDVNGWQASLQAAQTARLTRERLWRGPLALAGAAALLWMLRRLGGRRPGWRAACAMIYLLVFNLRYAVMDGRTYSFSSVSSLPQLFEYVGITTAFALFLSWLVYVWRANLLRCAPYEAAVKSLKYSLTVLAILALPALTNYLLNGLVARWNVPEPVSFFLGLLALMQISFVALSGLLFSGLAAFAAWLLRTEKRQALAGSVKPSAD